MLALNAITYNTVTVFVVYCCCTTRDNLCINRHLSILVLIVLYNKSRFAQVGVGNSAKVAWSQTDRKNEETHKTTSAVDRRKNDSVYDVT